VRETFDPLPRNRPKEDRLEAAAQVGIERARRIGGVDRFGREKPSDRRADLFLSALRVERDREIGERLEVARGIVDGSEGGQPPLRFGTREVTGPVRLDSGFPPLARIVALGESRSGQNEHESAGPEPLNPEGCAPAPGDEEDTIPLSAHSSEHVASCRPREQPARGGKTDRSGTRSVSERFRPFGAPLSRAPSDGPGGSPARTGCRDRRGRCAPLPARFPRRRRSRRCGCRSRRGSR